MPDGTRRFSLGKIIGVDINPRRKALAERFGMYMDGKINIGDLITHVMPLERINEAFDLRHRDESLRSVVTF